MWLIYDWIVLTFHLRKNQCSKALLSEYLPPEQLDWMRESFLSEHNLCHCRQLRTGFQGRSCAHNMTQPDHKFFRLEKWTTRHNSHPCASEPCAQSFPWWSQHMGSRQDRRPNKACIGKSPSRALLSHVAPPQFEQSVWTKITTRSEW